jgi:hypothetical protein
MPDASALMFNMPARDMLDELATHIQHRLNGRVQNLRLSLRGATGLVLEGRTRTYYAKQLAQHAVMQVIDLPICANDIEVI